MFNIFIIYIYIFLFVYIFVTEPKYPHILRPTKEILDR